MLIVGALLAAVVVGPWLARVAARLAARDDRVGVDWLQAVIMTALLAVLLVGAVLLTAARPAMLALAWASGAALVLGAVDLASHRLPDRVTYPTAAVCSAAFVVDAAVTGSWASFGRALISAAVVFAVAYGAAAISPAALGLGDVKLLGLIALVLGWFGWGVLLTGVFLGLFTGAAVSLVLLLTRRAGWRTALPFGPPLLVGAVIALALG